MQVAQDFVVCIVLVTDFLGLLAALQAKPLS